MLQLHRVDQQIIMAAERLREGGTVSELVEQIRQQNDIEVKPDAIRRHLDGLVWMGVLEGKKVLRCERLVTVWVSNREQS